MTRASKRRRDRQRRKAQPSAPRIIAAANDNLGAANDNRQETFPDVEPGVKETPGQRIFRQMLRRALAEKDAALPVRGYDPAALTGDQIKRLRRADELLKSPDPSKVAGAKATIGEIARAVRNRVEAHRRSLEQAETKALEIGRGSEIAPPGKNEPAGRIRIASRDGLETLFTAKAITTTQHAAGLRFRADYEHTDPERGLTPLPIDQSRNITRGGEGWAEKLEEIKRRVAKLEREIQADDPTFKGANAVNPVHRIGRRVWALREIAGKGSNLRGLGLSGNSREAVKTHLMAALDVCAVHYALE